MATTSVLRNEALSEPEAARHQTEGWGAEVEQLLVEALVGVLGAPRGAGLLSQTEDLELAPGVATVRGVEGGPGRLASGGRAPEVSVLLEAAGGLLHRHRAAVQADRHRQAG